MRNAVRRNVSVLAKPAANCEGSVACLTTANGAPNPNDFQPCASSRPTKIQIQGGIVTLAIVITPRVGATNQTPKPSVEINPNGVSAYREPIRSEMAPPGYGKTAEMMFPTVPKRPTTTPEVSRDRCTLAGTGWSAGSPG